MSANSARENYSLSTLRSEIERRQTAQATLLAFTSWTTPRWKPGPIHVALCAALDKVTRGEVDRLLVLCPPQHGKSTVASRRFPAYALGNDPTLDVISSSATADLAEEFGRDVRNCISDPDYGKLFPDTALAEDSAAKGRWNTSQGGGYYAVGVGGTLFGRGAQIGLIDDPFPTWERAQSDLERRRVWDWYTGTFYNRIRPGGAIVVIQHRMHEDDLVGRLLDSQQTGDKWEVVNLPADPDNPPWPERYDREALLRLKANMDARQWSALYMQNPVPDEGDYFKRDWFAEYEKLPTGLHVYGASDYAVTDGGGDYTEHGVFGVDFNRNVYLLDWWRGQTTSDVWIERKCDLIIEHEPLCWFGEAGPIRRSIEPFLMRRMTERQAMCRIEWLPSIADKPTRARAFQALASMGKVHLPKSAAWKDEILGQLLRFPAGKFDDGVDVCSLLGRGLEFVKSPKAKRKQEQSPVYAIGGWMG